MTLHIKWEVTGSKETTPEDLDRALLFVLERRIASSVNGSGSTSAWKAYVVRRSAAFCIGGFTIVCTMYSLVLRSLLVQNIGTLLDLHVYFGSTTLVCTVYVHPSRAISRVTSWSLRAGSVGRIPKARTTGLAKTVMNLQTPYLDNTSCLICSPRRAGRKSWWRRARPTRSSSPQ